MAVEFLLKSGTAAQIATAAGLNGLDQGALYRVTDQDRIALGLSASTYVMMAKLSEVSGAVWGSITGTLSAQTDLQAALNGKLAAAANSVTTTNITDNNVTLAKLSTVASQVFLGRTTAGTGNVEALNATQATAMLNTFSDVLKGLVPASGGGTTNFLRADGTWAAPGGGGGGTPGGVTGSIQYNDGTTFAGSANLTYDATTGLILTEGGTTSGIVIATSTTYPSPPADGVAITSRVIAGTPKLVWTEGPGGRIYAFQKSWLDNRYVFVKPGNGTAQTVFGTAVTNVGTLSHTVLSDASRLARTHRTRFRTAATTAGTLTSQRSTTYVFANREQYEYRERIRPESMVSGNRLFFGLASSISAPTNIDPLSTVAPARVGIGFNANTGNWRLIHSSGSAITAVDLGASFPVNLTDLIELTLNKANDVTDIYYRVRNMTTPASVEGVLTTNVPAITALMSFWKFMTNNATTGTVGFESTGVHLELER